LLQRAGEAVEPAGQSAEHGKQREQFVGGSLLHGSRRHLCGHLVRRVRACFAGYVDPGRQQAEGTFQGAEGAQDGGDPGRDGPQRDRRPPLGRLPAAQRPPLQVRAQPVPHQDTHARTATSTMLVASTASANTIPFTATPNYSGLPPVR
jgi:hypothetical protein